MDHASRISVTWHFLSKNWDHWDGYLHPPLENSPSESFVSDILGDSPASQMTVGTPAILHWFWVFQRWVGWVQTIHSCRITHGWLWKPQKKRHKCASDWWFGTFFMFPYIAKSNPNWLIFFRGVETTNQECSWCSWSLHFFRNYWYKHLCIDPADVNFFQDFYPLVNIQKTMELITIL